VAISNRASLELDEPSSDPRRDRVAARHPAAAATAVKFADDHILTVNGGSSGIKFALFRGSGPLKRILNGSIDGVGRAKATMRVKVLSAADTSSRVVSAPDPAHAVRVLMDWIDELRPGTLTAVGHRVVHGGPKYGEPQRITADLVAELKRMSAFDPEHLPEEILLVEAFQSRLSTLPQVACFDTAFHHDMPRVAQLLPIPRRYEALAGIEAARGRVILAHLGNGSSLAAVRDGRSVDTSMSFTPASGIPMSTRSGDLDPGLAWYLACTEGMTPKQFNEMVQAGSGLLGMSETSSDMRDLLEHQAADVRAAEAVLLYCYTIKKCIGSFAAALGGIDTLVFSGGIGENAPTVRAGICEGLRFLGVELDVTRNLASEGGISKSANDVTVRVIRTDEEVTIAKAVRRVLHFDSNQET
jgi:acetate kinase